MHILAPLQEGTNISQLSYHYMGLYDQYTASLRLQALFKLVCEPLAVHLYTQCETLATSKHAPVVQR